MSMNKCLFTFFVRRQYEEKQLVAQQEKTQKRLEFQKQEGRLQSQVSKYAEKIADTCID